MVLQDITQAINVLQVNTVLGKSFTPHRADVGSFCPHASVYVSCCLKVSVYIYSNGFMAAVPHVLLFLL